MKSYLSLKTLFIYISEDNDPREFLSPPQRGFAYIQTLLSLSLSLEGKKGHICQLLYIKFIILEFLSRGENPSPRTGPLGPHCVSCGLLRHEEMALRCSVNK